MLMKIRKKSKKGAINLLGEHGMELIIAVLCILALVYLGYRVYSYVSDNSALEKADASLKIIAGYVDEVKSFGDIKEFNIQGPKEWFVNSYYASHAPFLCEVGKDCICLCKKNDFNTCSSKTSAVCKSFERDILKTDFEIKSPLQKIKLSLNNGKLLIEGV